MECFCIGQNKFFPLICIHKTIQGITTFFLGRPAIRYEQTQPNW